MASGRSDSSHQWDEAHARLAQAATNEEKTTQAQGPDDQQSGSAPQDQASDGSHARPTKTQSSSSDENVKKGSAVLLGDTPIGSPAQSIARSMQQLQIAPHQQMNQPWGMNYFNPQQGYGHFDGYSMPSDMRPVQHHQMNPTSQSFVPSNVPAHVYQQNNYGLQNFGPPQPGYNQYGHGQPAHGQYRMGYPPHGGQYIGQGYGQQQGFVPSGPQGYGQMSPHQGHSQYFYGGNQPQMGQPSGPSVQPPPQGYGPGPFVPSQPMQQSQMNSPSIVPAPYIQKQAQMHGGPGFIPSGPAAQRGYGQQTMAPSGHFAAPAPQTPEMSALSPAVDRSPAAIFSQQVIARRDQASPEPPAPFPPGPSRTSQPSSDTRPSQTPSDVRPAGEAQTMRGPGAWVGLNYIEGRPSPRRVISEAPPLLDDSLPRSSTLPGISKRDFLTPEEKVFKNKQKNNRKKRQAKEKRAERDAYNLAEAQKEGDQDETHLTVDAAGNLIDGRFPHVQIDGPSDVPPRTPAAPIEYGSWDLPAFPGDPALARPQKPQKKRPGATAGDPAMAAASKQFPTARKVVSQPTVQTTSAPAQDETVDRPIPTIRLPPATSVPAASSSLTATAPAAASASASSSGLNPTAPPVDPPSDADPEDPRPTYRLSTFPGFTRDPTNRDSDSQTLWAQPPGSYPFVPLPSSPAAQADRIHHMHSYHPTGVPHYRRFFGDVIFGVDPDVPELQDPSRHAYIAPPPPLVTDETRVPANPWTRTPAAPRRGGKMGRGRYASAQSASSGPGTGSSDQRDGTNTAPRHRQDSHQEVQHQTKSRGGAQARGRGQPSSRGGHQTGHRPTPQGNAPPAQDQRTASSRFRSMFTPPAAPETATVTGRTWVSPMPPAVSDSNATPAPGPPRASERREWKVRKPAPNAQRGTEGSKDKTTPDAKSTESGEGHTKENRSSSQESKESYRSSEISPHTVPPPRGSQGGERVQTVPDHTNYADVAAAEGSDEAASREKEKVEGTGEEEDDLYTED